MRYEGASLRVLSSKGSTASRVCRTSRLTRDVIRQVLHPFSFSRIHQVTFASITCGTRFHFIDQNRRLPARCCVTGGCDEEDGFEHLIYCADLGPVPEGDEDLLSFIARVVSRAAEGDPGFPVPLLDVAEGEIEINFPAPLVRSKREISL